MQNKEDMKDKTIKELARTCHTVDDFYEMLKNLFKDTIQEIFEAEMDEHLGYPRRSPLGDNSGTAATVTAKKQSKPDLAIPNLKSQETGKEISSPG